MPVGDLLNWRKIAITLINSVQGILSVMAVYNSYVSTTTDVRCAVNFLDGKS
jgi:hypothetical protein